jgi:hypothetical protein
MSKRQRSKPPVVTGGGPPAPKRTARKRGRLTPKRRSLNELPVPNLPHRFHVGEVAASFGISPRTVRSWHEKGLLEWEKVGNAVFIRTDQIDDMLKRAKEKKKP